MSAFQIHPFLIIDVVQMHRHGELEQAARFIADELLQALAEREERHGAQGSAGTDDDNGSLMLPTLQRRQQLGYSPVMPPLTSSPTKAVTTQKEIHDDYNPTLC